MATRKPPTTDIDVSQSDEHALADAAYDKIRRRAYEIWEREGRPTGRQHEHWAQAECEVLNEAGIPSRPADAERPG